MLDNVATALVDWKADQRPGDSASHKLNGVVRKTTNHVEGAELLLPGRLLRGRADWTGPGGVARSRVPRLQGRVRRIRGTEGAVGAHSGRVNCWASGECP